MRSFQPPFAGFIYEGYRSCRRSELGMERNRSVGGEVPSMPNMNSTRSERLDQGLCPECGREPKGVTTKLGDTCRAKKNEASKKSRSKKRSVR